MNWNKGFTARYYLNTVDAASWRDLQSYDLTEGSITRSVGELIEAADVGMTQIPNNGDVWIRIYLDAKQDGESVHTPVFTGLMTAPTKDWNGIKKEYKVECYSVLKPAADVLLERGWYVSAGSNGAKTAAALLKAGPAPVSYAENAPLLSGSVVAEDGESCLSMAWKLINAIGWRIRINGNGEIDVVPKASEYHRSYDAFENDAIEMEITDTRDWFSCPNVFRAISGDTMAIARDDRESSPFSTASRGREIWMEETGCALNENESISAYAIRRLKEEQTPARQIKYTRRYYPDMVPGDLIRIHHPAQGIDGIFRIISQKTELGYNARTYEEVVEE